MIKNLIIIILVIVLEAVFAILNLDNRSDISIGFTVFEHIPVFITIIISFTLGALICSPIAFIAGKKYTKSSEAKKEIKNQKKLLKEKKIYEDTNTTEI